MTDENQTENTAPPSVGLADIAFLLQTVEICSQRGAFRAEELSSVGAIYDKVKAFIAANSPPAKTEGEAPTEGSN